MKLASILLAAGLLFAATEVRAEVGTFASADGSRVLTRGKIYPGGDSKDVAVVWDATTGKELQKIGSEYELHMSASLSPDGKIVALSGAEKNNPAAMMFGITTPFLQLYDAETGKTIRKIPCNKFTPNIVAFSPGGKTVAGTSVSGAVKIGDLADGKLRELSPCVWRKRNYPFN